MKLLLAWIGCELTILNVIACIAMIHWADVQP
jgi:hypothetical protein